MAGRIDVGDRSEWRGIFYSHLMLALAIEKFGAPAQKKQWLPKPASGEIAGGLALTEPDAGGETHEIPRVIVAKQWIKRNPVG